MLGKIHATLLDAMLRQFYCWRLHYGAEKGLFFSCQVQNFDFQSWCLQAALPQPINTGVSNLHQQTAVKKGEKDIVINFCYGFDDGVSTRTALISFVEF